MNNSDLQSFNDQDDYQRNEEDGYSDAGEN